MSAVERDYAAEMRAVINEATSHGPYVSALVASDVVEKLAANDPDLLDGWLRLNAVPIIRHMINLRDCATRTRARVHARRNEFADDAEAFEAGDRSALAGWLAVVHVVEDGSRKRLSEMNALDLRHVADDYDARARDNAMMAAFLRAVAKRVGKRIVADVYDDQTLDRLWRSLAGS